MNMPFRPKTIVPEGSTCVITATVKDHNDVAIPVASITTATLEINDQDTGNVIRAAGDIKADINSSGVLDTLITAVENAIVTQTLITEIHLVTIKIVGTAGDGKAVALNSEIWIKLQSLKYVT